MAARNKDQIPTCGRTAVLDLVVCFHVELCQTRQSMSESTSFDGRRFVVLRKKDAVPVLAGCTLCGRKFFTPVTLFDDAEGADRYLQSKFDSHECQFRSSSLNGF